MKGPDRKHFGVPAAAGVDGGSRIEEDGGDENRRSECQRALHEARLAALPHTKTCSRRCDVRRCRPDRKRGQSTLGELAKRSD